MLLIFLHRQPCLIIYAWLVIITVQNQWLDWLHATLETSFTTNNALWPAHRITHPLRGLFNPFNLYGTATSSQDIFPILID